MTMSETVFDPARVEIVRLPSGRHTSPPVAGSGSL